MYLSGSNNSERLGTNNLMLGTNSVMQSGRYPDHDLLRRCVTMMGGGGEIGWDALSGKIWRGVYKDTRMIGSGEGGRRKR